MTMTGATTSTTSTEASVSNVSIERGFRVPIAQYRHFPAQLHSRLPAVMVPYVRTKIAEIVADLQGLDPEQMRRYAVNQAAPRGYTPSRFTEHLLGKGVADSRVAVALLKDWAPFFMHRHQSWSSYDTTIRIDLWQPHSAATGHDAEYVYGRVVTVPADEVYIEILGIPSVEEFSYFDREDGAGEWEAREHVWDSIVDDDSRTEWHFVPDELWLLDVAEGAL